MSLDSNSVLLEKVVDNQEKIIQALVAIAMKLDNLTNIFEQYNNDYQEEIAKDALN